MAAELYITLDLSQVNRANGHAPWRMAHRRRPIFIATLRAARLLAGCFVAHRSKTTAGILPLRFAHPAKIRSSATTPVTDLAH